MLYKNNHNIGIFYFNLFSKKKKNRGEIEREKKKNRLVNFK